MKLCRSAGHAWVAILFRVAACGGHAASVTNCGPPPPPGCGPHGPDEPEAAACHGPRWAQVQNEQPPPPLFNLKLKALYSEFITFPFPKKNRPKPLFFPRKIWNFGGGFTFASETSDERTHSDHLRSTAHPHRHEKDPASAPAPARVLCAPSLVARRRPSLPENRRDDRLHERRPHRDSPQEPAAAHPPRRLPQNETADDLPSGPNRLGGAVASPQSRRTPHLPSDARRLVPSPLRDALTSRKHLCS